MDPWTPAIRDFTTYLRAANRSPNTVRLMAYYIGLLPPLASHPDAITQRQLLRILTANPWSGDAKKNARTAWRNFYQWATTEGITISNPAADLPTIRVPEADPRPAPEQLVIELLTQPDDRLSLMTMLAAFCGLRAAEIAAVHRRDVTPGSIRITAKGGHQRQIPIESRDLQDRLDTITGWAFPSPHPRHEHITAGTVTKILSKAMPGDWTGHTLRHRCATVALDETGDLLAVSKLLGHRRVQTTQRYTRLADQRLRAAARAATI